MKEIIDSFDKQIKKILLPLSVSPLLTVKITNEILSQLNLYNELEIKKIKKYPIWVRVDENIWAIDKKIKNHLISSITKSDLTFFQKVTLLVLKENEDFFKQMGYSAYKNFQLQILRLSLNIPENQEESLFQIRTHFESAEFFNNHESARVLSILIDEVINIKSISEPSENLLSVLYIKALYLYRKRDYDNVIDLFELILKYHNDSYNSLKDASMVAHFLGIIWNKKNKFQKSEKCLLESIEMRKKISDLIGISHTLHSLGNLYQKETKYHYKSEKCYLESIEIEKKLGRNFSLSQLYHSLANLYSKNEKYFDISEKYYKKSIKLKEQVDDFIGLAQAYHSLGVLYSNYIQHEADAIRMYDKSLIIEKKLKNLYGIAIVNRSLGKLFYKKGDLVNAKTYFQESLKFERDNKYIIELKNYIKSI